MSGGQDERVAAAVGRSGWLRIPMRHRPSSGHDLSSRRLLVFLRQHDGKEQGSSASLPSIQTLAEQARSRQEPDGAAWCVLSR